MAKHGIEFSRISSAKLKVKKAPKEERKKAKNRLKNEINKAKAKKSNEKLRSKVKKCYGKTDENAMLSLDVDGQPTADRTLWMKDGMRLARQKYGTTKGRGDELDEHVVRIKKELARNERKEGGEIRELKPYDTLKALAAMHKNKGIKNGASPIEFFQHLSYISKLHFHRLFNENYLNPDSNPPENRKSIEYF